MPTELIQAGGNTVRSSKSGINKEALPVQWKEPTVAPVHKQGDKTDLEIIVKFHGYQLHT
jgi:hypothetical protein